MTDVRQSTGWANYLKSINWQIEKVDNIYIYIKKIPFLGNFIKIQRPAKLNQATIELIEKKYYPFQFTIEPLNESQIKIALENNFKLSSSPSLPTKTLTIDLKQSEKELLSSFSQKVRYNIKLSQKKNIQILESKNILDFTNFWRKNFERKRLPFLSQQKNIITLHKSFGKNSKILLAKQDNNIVASLFLLSYNKTTYYMYAASNNEGRKYFAPTLLTWQAILLSKKLKNTLFDFDGIYDDRFPIKSWRGFSKFKYGFSNTEIQYPGMFTKTKILSNLIFIYDRQI